MRLRSRIGLLIFATLAAAIGGSCASKLETGYEPRRLGASPAERRAFYAPRFTPEARAADEQRRQDADSGFGAGARPR